MGNSTTTIRDLYTIDDIKMIVTVLGESVARRLREQNFKGQCVHLGLQDVDMRDWSKQTKLQEPTYLSSRIIEAAMGLFQSYGFDKPARNVSLTVSDLCRADCPQQLDFQKRGKRTKSRKA